MSQITTHILDTAIGQPASQVPVLLEQKKANQWHKLADGKTDENGRIAGLLAPEMKLSAGDYRLRFNTEIYFSSQSKSIFYPYVEIVFSISESQKTEHFHIPLLISPFGYSTYRGS